MDVQNAFVTQLNSTNSLRLALIYVKENYGNQGLTQIIEQYGLVGNWTIFGGLLKNGENQFLTKYLETYHQYILSLPDDEDRKIHEELYQSYINSLNNS